MLHSEKNQRKHKFANRILSNQNIPLSLQLLFNIFKINIPIYILPYDDFGLFEKLQIPTIIFNEKHITQIPDIEQRK